MTFTPRLTLLITGILATGLLLFIHPDLQAENTMDRALIEAVSGFDREQIDTGLLYDRVLPMSNIGTRTGARGSEPTSLANWKQIYYEMYRASTDEPSWPSLEAVLTSAEYTLRDGRVPIALMTFDYNRIRPDALEQGLLTTTGGRLVATGKGDPFVRASVFAAAALKDDTYRGSDVVFLVDRALYATNRGMVPERLQIDFDDGRGWRAVRFDGEIAVSYGSSGQKTVSVRAEFADGSAFEGGFYFRVVSLQAPLPDDTLMITSTIPYNAGFAGGEAYVYRSNANSTLKLPAILVEGFDLDNGMNWDELYELTNQEGLLDTLRGWGYDAVVLNFDDATDYLQRNAFVLVELIEQVQSLIAPGTEFVVVGASMGGLVSRYALAYMETHALPHRARLFVSFDSPQKGAAIPLGVQHWVDFFSGQSTAAADLLVALNSPAARQMLVYHHSVLPTTTGAPDPLRAAMESDFAAVGQYPANLRKVAFANGSGSQATQGFAPGAQIIDYEYSNLFTTIRGNVWAVPDGGSAQILDGLISIIIPLASRSVTVSGTAPYDNAPGGYRGSMAQMDATTAPYGDIVAVHDNHCFIPTISALDLATTDLFYDIAGDPNVLAMSPFDAVYYPLTNEEHVDITPQNAQWILSEIGPAPTGIAGTPVAAPAPGLAQNVPNPFNPTTTIAFSLPETRHVSLTVFSADGRPVQTLVSKTLPAGPHEIEWNGRDARGHTVASGVYFYRLQAGSFWRTRKMVLLK